MSVIALIPAYNEASTIGATVKAIRAIPEVTGVLVIDDGSRDATAQLARDAGAEVIRNAKNRGKGAALQHGVEHLGGRGSDDGDGGSRTHAATSAHPPAQPAAHPDIVLLLDGDLGTSASEAQALLYPVLDGLADMTIGVLPKPPGSGGFGVVKDLARSAIRDWGGGYDAQAPLSGQRALSWECLQAVLPFAEGYGVEVALSIRALQADFRLLEVRVDMQHRATGRDLAGFIHRGRQYLDVYRTIQRLERQERETQQARRAQRERDGHRERLERTARPPQSKTPQTKGSNGRSRRA
ncbi:MAG: glycosyltransferase family 2 protein [Coriobacteriales bacterium]|jgi:glycosyltransferase involved in cell wall biosynthesis|nr:glycosyltransferase family 2 protein [Coriobacteriales bacterium]